MKTLNFKYHYEEYKTFRYQLKPISQFQLLNGKKSGFLLLNKFHALMEFDDIEINLVNNGTLLLLSFMKEGKCIISFDTYFIKAISSYKNYIMIDF
jgi:hypothetical protein